MTAKLPSLNNLKPNPGRAALALFDRTEWKRMAFGAFAEGIGERAEPKDAQEEIYGIAYDPLRRDPGALVFGQGHRAGASGFGASGGASARGQTPGG